MTTLPMTKLLIYFLVRKRKRLYSLDYYNVKGRRAYITVIPPENLSGKRQYKVYQKVIPIE